MAYVSTDGDSFDSFVASFVAPAPQRFSEPEVTELDTDFGEAVRLQQIRIVDEADGGEPSVQTSWRPRSGRNRPDPRR